MSKIQKVEGFLGGLKFAVIIICIFSILMTVGTFLESYYGAEFANRVLYKTWPFMLVQRFVNKNLHEKQLHLT